MKRDWYGFSNTTQLIACIYVSLYNYNLIKVSYIHRVTQKGVGVPAFQIKKGYMQ